MEEAALRTRRLLGALALAAIFVVPSVSAAYFGSLLSTDGGIDGTRNRITNPAGVSFSWDVTQDADNSWHYSYVFKHPERETSHFSLGASDRFTTNGLFDLHGDFGGGEVGSIEFRVPPPKPVPPPPAPEPATLMLLGSGLLGSAAIFRRRRK